ncbi:hypothetical protein RJ641_014248 [Dillenia turbinata]|uniref:Uncharacterized protein n=1 Tax=Dillenia turbinata TaxID=194707 RepID=A0AAN8URU5_9MAGN
MVSKVEVAMKQKQQPKQQQQQHHQQQLQKQIMQCNKGKVSKFKRSSSNLEEDGASSAILLLACIAFMKHMLNAIVQGSNQQPQNMTLHMLELFRFLLPASRLDKLVSKSRLPGDGSHIFRSL